MNKIQMTELIRTHHANASGRQIEMYINMAADRLAEKSSIVRHTFTYDSVAGQRWYDISDRIMRIDKVYFNDVKIPKLVGDPIIDDDEFTNPSDTADSPLSTPVSNSSNKRMWMISDYENDRTAAKKRRLGIVEKVANSVTRDGRTSDYQTCSISGTKNIRIYAVCFTNHFGVDNPGTDETDSMLSTVGPLKDIPAQFHEVLLTGAIAIGYKYPPNIDLNMAAAFENEFELGIKRVKSFQRTQTTTGFIKPHDF